MRARMMFVDEVLELLLELDASEEQLDSPVVFCSARQGTASLYSREQGTDLKPLFDSIINHIDPPEGDPEAPLQVLVSSIDFNDYVGRLAIGRIENGTMRQGQEVALCDHHDPSICGKARLTAIYQFDGLGRQQVEEAKAGDIVCFSGIESVNIGNTVCAPDHVEAIPFVKISEPTMEMTFSVNNSPFAGREGKLVTSAIFGIGCKASSRKMSLCAWRIRIPQILSACWGGEKCTSPSSSKPCAGRVLSCR